jgi:hypothetical protein
MQTREKGNLTEAKILAALVAAGYLVSVPFGEGHKYDFIIDDSVNLRRVQCKTGRVKKGVLLFNSYSQSGNGATKQGYYGLADLFAVLNPESGEVYFSSGGKLRNDRRYFKINADFEWTGSEHQLSCRLPSDPAQKC